MADSSSSSNCMIQRLSSLPRRPSEWDFCPEETEFVFKVKNENGKNRKIAYTLKEGVPLPYKPALPGLKLLFLIDFCKSEIFQVTI